MSALRYWKCKGDCLEVVATDFDILTSDRCSICGGSFAFMGIVQDAKLYKVEERCACNHSCTHAQGPKCDCGCHGANHGTGMTVQRMIVNGSEPVIPAHDAEKAMARMREWRPIRKRIEHGVEIMRSISGYGRNTGYNFTGAGYSITYRAWAFVPMYRKLLQLKSHFHRMKNGRNLLKKMDQFVDLLITNFGNSIPVDTLTKIQDLYYERKTQ